MINLTRTYTLLLVVLLAAGTSGLRAQPACSGGQEGERYFDLVIFGSGLERNDPSLSLKTNLRSDTPGLWEAPETGEGMGRYRDRQGEVTLAFTRLPCDRYLGQDIRENYLALRLASGGESDLRAAYVLPHTGTAGDTLAEIVAGVIRSGPLRLERLSLAAFVSPRPKRLSPGDTLIEHLEMPVRGYPPGVREVEWLEILFGSR